MKPRKLIADDPLEATLAERIAWLEMTNSTLLQTVVELCERMDATKAIALPSNFISVKEASAVNLESLVLERKLRHGNHQVLTMCRANATVERNAAGNRKLSKKRSSGRIDGAVALAMAIVAAPAAWTAKVDIAALIG
jgi:phage terminase large subunit-like protein